MSADIKDVNTFEPPSSASYRSQTFRMSSASLHRLSRAVMRNDRVRELLKTYPRMISMASTRIHRGRLVWPCALSEGSASLLSAPMIRMSNIRKTSDSVFSSDENCFSSKKTTRVQRNVRGKFGLSESDLCTSGHKWCCSRSKSSGC